MPVSNHAVARAVLARDEEKGGGKASKKTVKVKIRWSKTTPPQKYLADAFDDNPVDWEGVVYINGVKKGTGDGELDVEMTEGETYSVRVDPTATGDDEYYEAASRKKLVAKEETVDVELKYNRENIRFTQESWDKAGLHRDEVGDVETVKMFGRDITGQHARQADGREHQHATSDSKALTDDDRVAVKESLVKSAATTSARPARAATATTRSAARWTSTSTWAPTSPTTGRRRARSRAPRATSG